jgi:hypothetical protein
MKTGPIFATTCATAALAAVASLAAVAAKAPAGRSEPRLPEYKVLRPISYKNLTIFPVAVAGEEDQKSLASRYITLDEGLKTGVVEIREMGGDTDDDGTPLQRDRPYRGIGGGASGGVGLQVQQYQQRQYVQAGAEVNRLALYNRSGKKLLLLAGEMVVGGRQDRIVQKDTLVPSGPKPLPLAVFCVEHGRWTAESTNFGNQIAGGGGGFGGGMADPAVRGVAQTKADQGEVWGAVARRGQTLGGESSTGTYQKIVAGPKAIKDAGEYMKAFEGKILREGVVGAVVAVNGKLVWADVFSSQTDFFERYWPKLLRSYALDAIATPPVATGYDRELWQDPTQSEASAFLSDRLGKATFEGQEDVYKLRRTEAADYVIYDIEDISLDPAVLLHTCKMTKR